jgi:hypothetical protein
MRASELQVQNGRAHSKKLEFAAPKMAIKTQQGNKGRRGAERSKTSNAA